MADCFIPHPRAACAARRVVAACIATRISPVHLLPWQPDSRCRLASRCVGRYLVARTPFESLAEARLTAGQDPYLRLFQGALRLSDRNK